jgi:glucose-1-phosphate cytidylyltransferase
VRNTARFGELTIENSKVTAFKEKTESQTQYINGGYFVFSKGIGDYIPGDPTVLEQQPFMQMSEAGRVHAYKHNGFWQCMDTFREQQMLEKMYHDGQAPWRVW